MPLLKLYDAFDPTVVRSSSGPDPIAANYTATLAVLDSYARQVAGSAAGSFLRPDNPRFATGIYLIHLYDPNKIPILLFHGLISSPLSWQNLTNDLCADRRFSSITNPGFFSIQPANQCWKVPSSFGKICRRTQRLFDPKGTAMASHHVVVIAHSMGGLLAHTLVSDSGDALWNVFADKPFNSLTLSPSEKNLISGYFFFHHQPSIERVIFLAVPHRGSGLASGMVGSIASRLIRRLKTAAEAMKEFSR